MEEHAQTPGELPLPPRRCLGCLEFLSRLRASARRTRGQAAASASTSRSVLPFVAADPAGRREAMLAAYASGGYTQREIAHQFGVHAATVSRAVGFSRQRRQVSTSIPN
jgi:DNA invertase Pin-like site-specific DNA recombinase